MVLISTDGEKKQSLIKRGFRPLTGIMVLIDTGDMTSYTYEVEEFPSPYGDYGSYQANYPCYRC